MQQNTHKRQHYAKPIDPSRKRFYDSKKGLKMYIMTFLLLFITFPSFHAASLKGYWGRVTQHISTLLEPQKALVPIATQYLDQEEYPPTPAKSVSLNSMPTVLSYIKNPHLQSALSERWPKSLDPALKYYFPSFLKDTMRSDSISPRLLIESMPPFGSLDELQMMLEDYISFFVSQYSKYTRTDKVVSAALRGHQAVGLSQKLQEGAELSSSEMFIIYTSIPAVAWPRLNLNAGLIADVVEQYRLKSTLNEMEKYRFYSAPTYFLILYILKNMEKPVLQTLMRIPPKEQVTEHALMQKFYREHLSFMLREIYRLSGQELSEDLVAHIKRLSPPYIKKKYVDLNVAVSGMPSYKEYEMILGALRVLKGIANE